MPQATLDIYDQAQLTAIIQRSITVGKENLPSLGDQLAPFTDVRERKLKWTIIEPNRFGVAQLRSPDGTPQLTRSGARRFTQEIELALPDEMERLSEDILLRLESTDPLIRASAGLDVATRGAILAARSYRRVEKMRWEMFLTGKTTLDYSDSTVVIDQFLPTSHVVTAGTLWSDTANADIIGQVRAWQKVVADDIGQYALHMYMNSNTWELVYNNAKIRALLSTYGRSVLVPTKDEVAGLFRDGTTITIYDGGYRDQLAPGAFTTGNLSRGDAQLTKWLPDGKVLLTTDTTLDGEKIADTPNGQVRIATGYNTAVWKQGPQSETILHPISKNEFLRYARANIPRLLIPEAFFVAQVT